MPEAFEAIPADAVADLLSRLLESSESLRGELKSGKILPRYLRMPDAAVFCGFVKKGREGERRLPDVEGFKRFAKEEGILAKRGNGGRGYLFAVADLDRAMLTRRVCVKC